MRRLTCPLMFAAMLNAVCHICAHAQEEDKPSFATPTRLSRPELREKQLDVSLESRDIERVLTKLKRASELAKSRISEAAKTAESASTALETGDDKTARGDADKTSQMFKEIIAQLEALLTEDTPQQVAAARNMAEELARLERQLAAELNVGNDGGGGSDGQQGSGKKGQPSDRKPDEKETVKRGSGKGEIPGDSKQGGGDEAEPNVPKTDGGGGTGDKPEKKGAEAGGASKSDPKSPADPDAKKGRGGGDEADPKAPKTDGGGGTGDKPEKKGTETGGASKSDPKTPADPDAKKGLGGGGRRNQKPMTKEGRREAVAERAEQLEAKAETLRDLLQAIAQSANPDDRQAVARLEAILKETEIVNALSGISGTAELIRDGRFDDARMAALDLAERLEIATQRLDAAYRKIVAPRAEELRKLEKALAELREKLNKLQTPKQIDAWHRDMKQLIDQAESEGVSAKAREDLLEKMQQAGMGIDGAHNKFDWKSFNGLYVPPENYLPPLLHLQEELQARIQILVLGDISSTADEATPPKYQDLVERYYQVLTGKETDHGKSPPKTKKRDK